MTKILITTLLLTLSITASASIKEIDDWFHSEIIDPITDEDTSIALTTGGGGSLGVRCYEGAPTVVANADAFLGSDQSLPVTWRVDKNEPVTTDVFVTDTLAWLPVSLMDEMEAGASIVIRFTDYRNRQHTKTFSLIGYHDATGLLGCVE